MTDLSYRWRRFCWGARNTRRRYVAGFAYATGRLTAAQANDVIYHCQPIAGWYPLATFHVDSVLYTAQDLWGDVPGLAEMAEDACDRVWQKWSDDSGDLAGAAEDWALNLIQEYAADRGITLIEQEAA